MNLEIFKAGKYRGQQYGRDFLDKIAASYNPAYHEAPAVIGHPKDNSPAYGWVKSLRVDGDLLVAELDDATLDKEFVEMVGAGKFKKRSASFYMDLNGKGPYLRHLGFLGATPPEVKGLKDVQFGDGGKFIDVEFGEGWMVASMFRRVRDWMIDQFGLDTADKVLPDWEIGSLESAPVETAATAYSDTFDKLSAAPSLSRGENRNAPPKADQGKETDMTEAEVRALMADQKKKDDAEFAEKLKAKDAEIGALKAKEAERGRAARKKEIADFCEQRKDKIIPAWKKAGIEDFLERLDAVEDADGAPLVIEFGEKKEKQTLRGWFENFLDSLPKVVTLGELCHRGIAAGGDDEREALIADFVEKHKLSYKDAAVKAAAKRPDLFADFAH